MGVTWHFKTMKGSKMEMWHNERAMPGGVKWKCDTCSRILLSKAGYVNHMKSHERVPAESTHVLPPQPGDTTCAVCEKTCKTTAGLKRHMKIHKDIIPQRSAVNPITVLDFICHICHRPCKSAAGLKSHLRAHGRTVNNQDDSTNGEDDGRHWDGWRLSRRSN